MAKKTTKNTPVETIPQTAMIVSSSSPETTLAIPLTTENIVDAAAYERQQDLEQRIAVIRDNLRELRVDHEAKHEAWVAAGGRSSMHGSKSSAWRSSRKLRL